MLPFPWNIIRKQKAASSAASPKRASPQSMIIHICWIGFGLPQGLCKLRVEGCLPFWQIPVQIDKGIQIAVAFNGFQLWFIVFSNH